MIILRQKQKKYSDLINQPEQPEPVNTKKSIGNILKKGRGEGLGKIGSAPALALKK